MVVTIIVLLILAGIAINLTIGNNGLFKRAEDASTESRGGAVEETKELWKTDRLLAKYSNNGQVESLEELLERLLKQKQITEKEKKEIEETGKVKIGSRTITFLDEQDIMGEYKGYGLSYDGENLEKLKMSFSETDLQYFIITKMNPDVESLTDEDVFLRVNDINMTCEALLFLPT